MQGITVTTFFALAAWFGLTLFAIQSWWTPPVVVILGLIFIAIPGVALAFATSPDLREAPNPKEVGAIVVMALIIGVGGSALWFIPQLRATAIEAIGQPKALAKAINEPYPVVQKAACRKYLKDNTATRTMFKLLSNRPTLAHECIQSVPSYTGRLSLEESLASNWYRRLFNDKQGDAQAETNLCTMTQTMDNFSHRESFSQDYRMLDCALNAPVEGRRYCCAGTLKRSGKTGSKLLATILKNERATITHFIPGPLVGLAFGEQDTVKRLKHVKGELALPEKSLQKASLKVACMGYIEGGRGQKSSRYLNWLFATEDTNRCLSAEERNFAKDITTVDICTNALGEVMSSDDVPKTICEAKQAAIKQAKLDNARRSKYNAETLAQMSNAINDGHSFRRTKGLQLDKMVKNFQMQGDALRYGGTVMPGMENYSEGDRQAFIGKVMGQMGNIPTDARSVRRMERNAKKRLKELQQNKDMQPLFEAAKPNGKIDKQMIRKLERDAKMRDTQNKLKGKGAKSKGTKTNTVKSGISITKN